MQRAFAAVSKTLPSSRQVIIPRRHTLLILLSIKISNKRFCRL